MRVSQVLPDTGTSHDPSTPEGRAWLADIYGRSDAAYVRLNMIASLTGAAAGEDGTSETLSSRVDRTILGIIRAAADVVIVGAATVRAERYLLPRSTPLVVVTVSGDLSGHRFDDGAGILLVCPADRADAVRVSARLPAAEILPVEGGVDLDPVAVVSALADRGFSRVVCEGGPILAARFAASGVIDEYCVTVAPVLAPAARSFLPLPEGTVVATEPVGLLVDDAAFSYLRLRSRS